MGIERNNNEVQQQELQEFNRNQLDSQLEEAGRQGTELDNKSGLDTPENIEKQDVSTENAAEQRTFSLDEKDSIEYPKEELEHEKKQFEDYSGAELQQMREENPYKLDNLNADFRERYEAEMYGMSQEEYRDYKDHLSRMNSQKEDVPDEKDAESSFDQKADQQRIAERQDVFREKLQDKDQDKKPENNAFTENISGESRLKEQLEQIKDNCFEKKDLNGNFSPEMKEQLVNDMKQVYDDTPKQERGDTLVPEKAEFLKDPPIAENKETGMRYDDVNYDWPKNGGFEGKPLEVTPQSGDKFDRLGSDSGRYVAPFENGSAQSIDSRGLPYHFTENDISKEPAYHVYEVDKDFTKLQDAINDYNNPVLTLEENEFMRNEFKKEYEKSNWASDEYTHEPGKTYYGKVAEAFEGGGGTQMELPMSVGSLEELGMIHEVKEV